MQVKLRFGKFTKPLLFWKSEFYLHGSSVLDLKFKPVLAMEREARLKEERDPNESQNVSCTSSGLRPRLLENSQKKPPRTKTRKHHRKNAKTLQK